MSGNKSSISKAHTYQEMGEFWDEHDLTDYWEETKEVEFTINIQTERRYYPIDRLLSNKVCEFAKKHGVSPETLVNLWVQEKVKQSETELSDAETFEPNKGA